MELQALSLKKGTLCFVLGALLYHTVLKLTEFYFNRKSNKEEESDSINDVLFFPDEVTVGKFYLEGGSKRNPSPYLHEDASLGRLIKFLERATTSLDVCIYLITCHDLAETIIRVHQRGAKVRVIADYDMAVSNGSEIVNLRKAGVPVRMKKSPHLMHHKFIVVDGKMVGTGSFNWTWQAISGNWDNLLITGNASLVQPYQEHFQGLWKEFSGEES